MKIKIRQIEFALCVLVLANFARAQGQVYALTGLSSTLVQYSAESLNPVVAPTPSGAWADYDLAFDQSGRLFGVGRNSLTEFNPIDGSIINNNLFSGGLSGLAARNGKIYSLSGLSPTLVQYDANTLLSVSGPAQSIVDLSYDLAFSETGRLFGVSSTAFYEFDPLDGTIINSSFHTGNINGLAARSGKIYSIGGLNTVLAQFDQDSLQSLSGDVFTGGSYLEYDLAFNDAGRLFGIGAGILAEFDPNTGIIINSELLGTSIFGIAAISSQIPEPSTYVALTGFSVLVFVIFSRRRKFERNCKWGCVES